MRVAITGATGTIGSAVMRALVERGDEVVTLTRDPERAAARLPAGAEAVRWRAPKAEVEPAQALAGRVVLTRTGVVMSAEGGALEKMLPPFRLGVGGPVAGGRQYVPWIDLEDVVGAILFCLDDERVSGPVNVSAPEPVTNKQLA